MSKIPIIFIFPSDFHTSLPIPLQTVALFFKGKHTLWVKYRYFKFMLEECMNLNLELGP